MFLPIYGTSQMITYIMEHNSIPDNTVLIVEEGEKKQTRADVFNRCINHGCDSEVFLRIMDFLSYGRVVFVNGDLYTGKKFFEEISVETFINEQIFAGRNGDFVKQVAEVCEAISRTYTDPFQEEYRIIHISQYK